MNEENKKKALSDKKLDKVDGGGFFSKYSDEEYAAAGVEIVGPGMFYNDGYRFKGKDITTEQAEKLAFFYYYKEYPAESVEQAEEYYDYMARVNYL